MTKEEAIKIIDCYDIGFYDLSGERIPAYKLAEAFDMATEALQDRPKGKWVGGQEYCKHLEEKTGERYAPTGLGKLIYCNQCWQANDRHSAYCPNCGADMRGADGKE